MQRFGRIALTVVLTSLAPQALLIPRRASCEIPLLALEGSLFPILELVKPEKIFFRCRATGGGGRLGPSPSNKKGVFGLTESPFPIG